MMARGTAEKCMKDYQATRRHMPTYCNLCSSHTKKIALYINLGKAVKFSLKYTLTL